MVWTWTELWFNSTNKSNPESNIRVAIGNFCHVSYGVCFNTAVKMNFCLCVDCSEPSVMENDVLNSTLGVWLVYEKGNISYIMTSFLLCCYLDLFFSFSAHLDPCCVQHQACTRHDVTVFVYCVSCLQIYKSVCLWEPQPFLFPRISTSEIVWMLFSPFLRKW